MSRDSRSRKIAAGVELPVGPPEDSVDRWLGENAAELPALDVVVEGVVDRIMSLSRRLRRSMDDTLESLGLSWDEFRLLGKLRLAPERRLSAGALAERLELSTGAMTNRLDRMEARGLLRRVANPADRRGVLVEITADGLDAWNGAVEAQAARERALASAAWERGELERVNDSLRRLMLVFERLE